LENRREPARKEVDGLRKTALWAVLRLAAGPAILRLGLKAGGKKGKIIGFFYRVFLLP
jgi:hypothetical protein